LSNMSDSPAFQSFLRAVAPSKFSAKANEDVSDWLTKVNRYFDLLKLTSADRVTAAILLLDGLPAKWALHIPAATQGQDPWQHFGNLLCQRFQSRNAKFFARQKLHSLKQTGSVTKYNIQFETTRSVLDDFGEAEAMHCYFMGLKPKIREHFAGNPNLRTNLSTMMSIAENLDNEQFHNSYFFKPSSSVSDPDPESFPQPMELDTMSGSSSQEKQKQLDLKNRACFKCHTPGHQS
ncbi:hypothetical protein BGX29_004925, partial [Mortierella sp. GBA35]